MERPSMKILDPLLDRRKLLLHLIVCYQMLIVPMQYVHVLNDVLFVVHGELRVGVSRWTLLISGILLHPDVPVRPKVVIQKLYARDP